MRVQFFDRNDVKLYTDTISDNFTVVCDLCDNATSDCELSGLNETVKTGDLVRFIDKDYGLDEIKVVKEFDEKSVECYDIFNEFSDVVKITTPRMQWGSAFAFGEFVKAKFDSEKINWDLAQFEFENRLSSTSGMFTLNFSEKTDKEEEQKQEVMQLADVIEVARSQKFVNLFIDVENLKIILTDDFDDDVLEIRNDTIAIRDIELNQQTADYNSIRIFGQNLAERSRWYINTDGTVDQTGASASLPVKTMSYVRTSDDDTQSRTDNNIAQTNLQLSRVKSFEFTVMKNISTYSVNWFTLGRLLRVNFKPKLENESAFISGLTYESDHIVVNCGRNRAVL